MVIRVSAVALVRGEAVLTVRKRGTHRFMLVGGKPDPGETPEECARREALEEVGLHLGRLVPLGRHRSAAANEPGHVVVADHFAVDEAEWGGEPEARAEIEELRWVPLATTRGADLAPLLLTRGLPALRRRYAVAPAGLHLLVVRPARSADVPSLPVVEQSGDVLFEEAGMAYVAGAPVAPVEAYGPSLAAGRLLVADVGGEVVGFARIEVLDGRAHLEQLSTRPEWSGAGVGGRLLAAAEEAARGQGFGEMTLRTYADVPWNGPFYRRRGWRGLPAEGHGPGLRRLAESEAAAGLDAAPRVVLVRRLAVGGRGPVTRGVRRAGRGR